MFSILFVLTLSQTQAPAMTPERVLALEGETHHVQGILVSGDSLFVTSVDRAARKGYLLEFSIRTGRRLRGIEIQDGDRFHPGGFDGDGKWLWIPVAEYRRNSTAVIQKRNRKTLQLEGSFLVRDHIGCVAVGGGRLFGGNWDSRHVYEWTPDGREIRKRDNPSAVRYQDIKWRKGQLVGSGLSSPGNGMIEWLDPGTLQTRVRLTFGKTDRDVVFTNEGMDWHKKRIYVLPEDTPSRLFIFKAPSSVR